MTDYTIVRSDRTTLEIAVLPDKRVVLNAPKQIEEEKIQKKVEKRKRWIFKQLDYFDQFYPRTTSRRYVSGETHLYLGKQYRLKVIQSTDERVLLKRGRFFIYAKSKAPEAVKEKLNEWYRPKAEEYFKTIFEKNFSYFAKSGYDRPEIRIRQMKKRWGSLSDKGNLTLNLRLIKAPKSSIEYVIVHELCHLVEDNHGSSFYKLLEKLLPDWKGRKERLEIMLS